MRAITAAPLLAVALALAACAGTTSHPVPPADAAFCAEDHGAAVTDMEAGGADLNALSGKLALDVTGATSYFIATGPATTTGNNPTFAALVAKVFSDCRSLG